MENVPIRAFKLISGSSLEEPDYQTLMKAIFQDFTIPEKPTRRKHPNQFVTCT